MRKVMIVDDEKSLRETLKDYFETTFEVIVPKDLRKVMEEFIEEKPQGILLDYDLGNGVKGTSFIEEIRKIEPKTVILMHSGSPQVEEECLRAGANGFIAKGDLSMAELKTIMAKTLDDQFTDLQ